MKKLFMLLLVSVCMSVFVACGCEHQFDEATCTTPQTCINCGKTQGEALGHTNEVGKCSRCNVMQGTDIIDQISAEIDQGDALVDKGLSYLERNNTTNTDVYNACCDMVDQFNNAAIHYRKAADLCGDYSTLSSLKQALNAAANNVPDKPSSDPMKMKTWLSVDAVYYVTEQSAIILYKECLTY